jgi:hypothetical protein
MTAYVFVDTITQVFESDGNLHIVGGLANGDVDLKGNDLLEKTLHLIIPMKKALRILPDISASLPKLSDEESSKITITQESPVQDDKEFEGKGFHFKI